jgi:hypothetical protein
MKNLKEASERMKSSLLRKLSISQVNDKFGRLYSSEENPSPYYRAVYLFERTSKKKVEDLLKILNQRKPNYRVEIEYQEKYRIAERDTGKSVLSFIASKGKPSEQENDLVKALLGLSKNL